LNSGSARLLDIVKIFCCEKRGPVAFKPTPRYLSPLPKKIGDLFLFRKRRLSYKKLTDFHQTSQKYHDTFQQARRGFVTPAPATAHVCPRGQPQGGKGKIQPKKEEDPMMSQIPIILSKVRQADIDKEILRAAIIAELDAVNLYEQLANMTDNAHIKSVLLDIAKEEKTHVGEFQEMLLRIDTQQKEELAHGQEEVEELVGKA
jgi:hypothetical protein